MPEIFTQGIASEYPSWKDWLFEPFYNERLLEDPLRWGNPQGLADAVSMFLDKLPEQAAGQIVLADIKLNQLYLGEGWFHQTSAPPQMFYRIADRSKIVFLRRRNLVRALVSGLQAEKSGVWHLTRDETDSSGHPAKITVDVDSFIAHLTYLERGLAEADCWLSKYPDTVHSVYYEDLFDADTLACNRQAFNAIATFAGMGEGPHWRSRFKKIVRHKLEEIVENFDEMKEKIPTRYASMLSDD